MARHSSDSLTAPLMAHNAARGCSRLRAALTTTGDGWTPLLPTTRLPTREPVAWMAFRSALESNTRGSHENRVPSPVPLPPRRACLGPVSAHRPQQTEY